MRDIIMSGLSAAKVFIVSMLGRPHQFRSFLSNVRSRLVVCLSSSPFPAKSKNQTVSLIPFALQKASTLLLHASHPVSSASIITVAERIADKGRRPEVDLPAVFLKNFLLNMFLMNSSISSRFLPQLHRHWP